MFRSYDHHQGDSQILAKITFIYNTLYVPILKTGDVAACRVMCVELYLGSACPRVIASAVDNSHIT